MRYFDANATTPLSPEARAAWLEASDSHWQNPSSPYRAAAQVHARMEKVRSDLAGLFGVGPETVVFNSGATEGNRDVFANWLRAMGPEARVGISKVEHPSVLENAQALHRKALVQLPVDTDGRLDLSALESALGTGISLVSLMAANNETGVLQPWPEAMKLCHARQVAFHVDASQWLGREPLDGLAQADFVSGCAHKFGGPKGVGFLLIGPAYSSFRGQLGGVQENDHRAGTENFPSIAAMGAALLAREAERELTNVRWREGRDAFEAAVSGTIPGVKFWAQQAPRLANTSSVCLPKGTNSRWVRLLDQRGFAVSTGSACATGKEGPSHVLAAMGACPEDAARTVRVSALPEATQSDWLELAAAFGDVWKVLGTDSDGSQVIEI